MIKAIFFNLGLLLDAQSNPLFRRALNIPADTYTEKLSGRRLKINNDIGNLVSHIGLSIFFKMGQKQCKNS